MARKVCPICGTVSHPNATVCPTCGASLTDVQPEPDRKARAQRLPGYDRRFGETDLFEGETRRSGEWLFTVIGLGLLAVVCIGSLAFALPRLNSAINPSPTPLATGSPTADLNTILITNTARPTLAVPLATVTPAPDTPTPPPTEGPCTYTVQPGDDLITLAYDCGHRSLEIVPAILELNDLPAPEAIQIGQTILIPRPTPTPDPAGASGPTPAGDAAASDVAALFVAEANATPPTATLMPTPTLLPGLMWHTVQAQESMVAIMYLYNTTAEVLAQINPEIAFSQCDFQFETGGPACTVLLQPGQLFRVPAPTPTPTLSPTPSGSETATPTPTATFNAPAALSPNDRARFTADQLITLRWVTTGQLAPGEKYRVTVVDETSGQTYSGETTDLTFIVPTEWQGTDGQPHEFRWSVGVAGGATDALRYPTPARSFIWNSRGTPP